MSDSSIRPLDSLQRTGSASSSWWQQERVAFSEFGMLACTQDEPSCKRSFDEASEEKPGRRDKFDFGGVRRTLLLLTLRRWFTLIDRPTPTNSLAADSLRPDGLFETLPPKLPATAVAISTYAIMAGYFTQSGVILGPAAAALGRSLPDTATLFSYLLGGNFLGIVVSLGIFDVLSIKRTLQFAYGVMFAGIALLCTVHGFAGAAAAIALVGFGGGLGLSTGAVIISQTYAANRRATAFLCTDCAFSVAGFVVPATVGAALAHGYGWPTGYVLVGLLAAAVLVGAARVQFPRPPTSRSRAQAPRTKLSTSAFVRIGLFGVGLSLYLGGQSVFLIWAPNDLQSSFGVPARSAASVVSSFWGPSIFGLVAAALIVTRVAPRVVLLVAMSVTAVCLLLIATATSAAAFITLTLGFGFCSTCLYKLMISIGSEQLRDAPPRLVTFLLLSGSVGGTLAPFMSAGVVRAWGPHAGPFLALGCYTGALIVIVIALAIERTGARAYRPLPVPS